MPSLLQNLPQDWEVKTLGKICEINPKNKLDDNLEVSFIPMNLIADKYQNKFSYEIRKWSEVKKGYTHLQNHCIAIAKITPCFENGKCVILQDLKNGYGAGTTELIVVLADKNKILPKFIFYFFNTTSFTKGGIKNFKGTAGQLRISKDFIVNLQIPLPPLETQQKIVAKLESEFAKIEAAKSHLEKVKETIPRLKNSLLKSAFSGKLTESAVIASKAQQSTMSQTLDLTVESNIVDCHEAKTSRNDESLPQGWEVKTLGEITNYGKTTQKQPKDLKPNDWILELEDIKKESGILLNKIAFKDRQSKSNKIIFHKGNVLFGTLRPYLKKVIIADDDGYCSSEIMPFDSGNEITNHYLAYLFLSDFMGNKIAMLTYGTRMPILGTKNGKELPIPLPPLQTQKQIVEILDSKFATLENLEKETNASLEKLHKLKSSLLNQAFKGELIC